MRPAAARRHHVEVGEDGELFPFAEQYLADVVVIVLRFKTHFPREAQKFVQRVRRALAEGHAGQGSRLRAVDAHEAPYRFDASVKILFRLNVHDHKPVPCRQNRRCKAGVT